MEKLIHEMNVAVLDTEASGRPAGQLWEVWCKLRPRAQALEWAIRWVVLDATSRSKDAIGAVGEAWIASLRVVLEDKPGPDFWYCNGALMCAIAIDGVTQDLAEQNPLQADRESTMGWYGGQFMVCESLSAAAAERIALALGGRYLGVREST